MTNVFEKINKLSFPAVLGIASLLTVASVLPLWVYITTRETALVSKANMEKPPLIIVRPADGAVPKSAPAITRVYPWFGKAGDMVVIEGTNFGAFPKNRRLAIGDIVVPDASIASWTDSRISVEIPAGSGSGARAALRIDTYPIVESLPLTMYNEETTAMLTKSGQTISIQGISTPIRATLWTQNGMREVGVTPTNNQPILLFSLSNGETIQSILVTDNTNTPIPYTANPSEFGF